MFWSQARIQTWSESEYSVAKDDRWRPGLYTGLGFGTENNLMANWGAEGVGPADTFFWSILAPPVGRQKKPLTTSLVVSLVDVDIERRKFSPPWTRELGTALKCPRFFVLEMKEMVSERARSVQQASPRLPCQNHLAAGDGNVIRKEELSSSFLRDFRLPG